MPHLPPRPFANVPPSTSTSVQDYRVLSSDQASDLLEELLVTSADSLETFKAIASLNPDEKLDPYIQAVISATQTLLDKLET